jgi:hypothetical protein
MTTSPPQRWLAGWFHFQPPYETFTGRNADVHSWDESAAWLRREMLEGVPTWGTSEITTMHRQAGPPFDVLSFPDHEVFVNQGLVLRKDRGVWAFDGERCFYIIRDDSGPESAQGVISSEGTPPLHMSLPPIVPEFLRGEPLPIRHTTPVLAPAR